MAPMKQDSNNYSSSNYGEDVVRRANVLASCYMVDSVTASLKGLHYCTTGATGKGKPALLFNLLSWPASLTHILETGAEWYS
jgi:hypothetical protein